MNEMCDGQFYREGMPAAAQLTPTLQLAVVATAASYVEAIFTTAEISRIQAWVYFYY